MYNFNLLTHTPFKVHYCHSFSRNHCERKVLCILWWELKLVPISWRSDTRLTKVICREGPFSIASHTFINFENRFLLLIFCLSMLMLS